MKDDMTTSLPPTPVLEESYLNHEPSEFEEEMYSLINKVKEALMGIKEERPRAFGNRNFWNHILARWEM